MRLTASIVAPPLLSISIADPCRKACGLIVTMPAALQRRRSICLMPLSVSALRSALPPTVGPALTHRCWLRSISCALTGIAGLMVAAGRGQPGEGAEIAGGAPSMPQRCCLPIGTD